MKTRERALSLVLSLLMVFAFMPSLAFAEAEESAEFETTPAIEEVLGADEEAAAEDSIESEALEEAPEETLKEGGRGITLQPPGEGEKVKSPAAGQVNEDWVICSGWTEWLWPGYGVELYGWVTNYSSVSLEFRWLKNGAAITEWADLTAVDSDGDLYNKWYTEESGNYTFAVREKADTSQTASAVFPVYNMLVRNNLVYYPDWEDDSLAWVEEISTSAATGNLVVPETVTLADGKTRRVDYIYIYAPNATSISIPAGATKIYSDLGYRYDESLEKYVVIPGFTIFGTTGSYAQTFANENGIRFRDLAAEQAAARAAAEAARNGTPDKNIPKVKISKPTAGKKSATVKWKKLSKKQLKKSKATKYEVWVCTNTGFAMGQTSEHMIKKSKTGVKIKKMPKGTYYVKVRAVREAGGVKYVGPWSKVKKVKVKK